MRMTHWFDRIIYILIGLCVLAVMQLPDAQVRLQIIAANMGALFIGIWGGVECYRRIQSSVDVRWFMRLLFWLHGAIIIGTLAVLIYSTLVNNELLLIHRLWLKHLPFWLTVISTLQLAVFVNPRSEIKHQEDDQRTFD